MGSGTRRAIGSLLVIEDDDAIRDVLVDLLETEGYRAFGAADGATGLRLMREERVELVLLDLSLPDLSGREVREQQLADETIADIPVIILTASAVLAFENLPLIRKPFDCDYLMKAIRREIAIAEEARHRELLAAVSDVRKQLVKSMGDLEIIKRASGDGPPSSRRR